VYFPVCGNACGIAQFMFLVAPLKWHSALQTGMPRFARMQRRCDASDGVVGVNAPRMFDNNILHARLRHAFNLTDSLASDTEDFSDEIERDSALVFIGDVERARMGRLPDIERWTMYFDFARIGIHIEIRVIGT
jgi:hypothetical protein